MKRRSKIAPSRSIAQALPAIFNGGAGVSVALLVLSVIFMVFSSFKPDSVQVMRLAVTDALTPVLKTVSMPLQNAALLVRDVSGLAEMQAENAVLKEENARLRAWYQTALMLQAENKSFRELLNAKTESARTFITARVVSDSGNAFANTLLIASGAQDGIQKGQAVMAEKGMIGRVIEVGDKAARILLITDINSRVPVLIEGTNQHAILAGDNHKAATLMHVPPESQIRDGARIMTSGYGGVFPYGLPLGVVKADENGVMKVLPLADIGKTIHVRIVEQMPDPYLRRGALGRE